MQTLLQRGRTGFDAHGNEMNIVMGHASTKSTAGTDSV